MASPSLSAFPNEIITIIFEYSPNLATAANLARSSPTFNAIWNRDTSSLCEKILSQTVQYYRTARIFAEDFLLSEVFIPLVNRQSLTANQPAWITPFFNYLHLLIAFTLAPSSILFEGRRILAPDMAPSQFSSLPPEICLLILENSVDLTSAVNLAKTYKHNHYLWFRFKKSICQSILSRTIQHYDLATSLIQLQQQQTATTPPTVE
ncbi:MAG: hypothetical protein Q9176_001403 [Flavoplaca citrina]